MRSRLLCASALGAAGLLEPASAAETIRVAVDKLTFAPAQITAHVGDTIEWVNHDPIAHTATGRNHEWDVAIPANGAGRVTLRQSGDVDYDCRFHPNMTGHISVLP